MRTEHALVPGALKEGVAQPEGIASSYDIVHDNNESYY